MARLRLTLIELQGAADIRPCKDSARLQASERDANLVTPVYASFTCPVGELEIKCALAAQTCRHMCGYINISRMKAVGDHPQVAGWVGLKPTKESQCHQVLPC